MNENDNLLNTLKGNKNNYKIEPKIDDKIALQFSINNNCIKKTSKRKLIILNNCSKNNKQEQKFINNKNIALLNQKNKSNSSYNSPKNHRDKIIKMSYYIEEEKNNINENYIKKDISHVKSQSIISINKIIHESNYKDKIHSNKKDQLINKINIQKKEKKFFQVNNKSIKPNKNFPKIEITKNNNLTKDISENKIKKFDDNEKLNTSNVKNNKKNNSSYIKKGRNIKNRSEDYNININDNKNAFLNNFEKNINYIYQKQDNSNNKYKNYDKDDSNVINDDKISNDYFISKQESINENSNNKEINETKINTYYEDSIPNEKEEDISDYININENYYQNILYNYEIKIGNEAIEEVEEEKEDSELTSLSTENIIKTTTKNTDNFKNNITQINENNNNIKENKSISFQKINIALKDKPRAFTESPSKKKISSYSKFINMKNQNNNDECIYINNNQKLINQKHININKSEKMNKKNKNKIKKEIINYPEKRKNKSVNNSALFLPKEFLVDVNHKKILIENNSKTKKYNNKSIDKNNSYKKQKIIKRRSKDYNLKKFLTCLTFQNIDNKDNKNSKNKSDNKNKICLSLINTRNNSYYNESINEHKKSRIISAKQNIKYLNLRNINNNKSNYLSENIFKNDEYINTSSKNKKHLFDLNLSLFPRNNNNNIRKTLLMNGNNCNIDCNIKEKKVYNLKNNFEKKKYIINIY